MGDERILTGVVNGIFEYKPDVTRQRLSKWDDTLTDSDLESLSKRYVVRVGYRRISRGALLIPFYTPKNLRSLATEYVLLPEGWLANAFEVSADEKVINVGDVVTVRTVMGRYYDFLDTVVRKCNAAATLGENRDWQLGCKTYQQFDEHGYAGEKYYIRHF
jgi:hypothetical protein